VHFLLLVPSVFYNRGSAFGNLGRNTIIEPGFFRPDFSLVEKTKITERLTGQVRGDFFRFAESGQFHPAGFHGRHLHARPDHRGHALPGETSATHARANWPSGCSSKARRGLESAACFCSL
jgi:hypothetical protein